MNGFGTLDGGIGEECLCYRGNQTKLRVSRWLVLRIKKLDPRCIRTVFLIVEMIPVEAGAYFSVCDHDGVIAPVWPTLALNPYFYSALWQSINLSNAMRRNCFAPRWWISSQKPICSKSRMTLDTQSPNFRCSTVSWTPAEPPKDEEESVIS
jgi:hypothetical protein